MIQNSVEIDRLKIGNDVLEKEAFVKYIPIDGKCSEEQRNKVISELSRDLRELPLGEIIFICTSLNAQKSAADYTLKYDFECPPLPEAKIEWAYGTKDVEHHPEKICKNTFRPYSTYGELKWEQHYE